jgi:hypothetical protein
VLDLTTRAFNIMNKQRQIKEQIKMLDRHLLAAERYVAKNVDVWGLSWLHLGDWKGKSGHPLWMKNHMIPATKRFSVKKERALKKIATKAKEKRQTERRKQATFV